MNKQQLASKIWESANKMRSKIEANEYKDYILGFIFYKFLSEQEEKYLKENDWTDEYLCELTEEDPEVVESIQKNLGYFISYNNLFSTWIKKGSDFSVQDVRDALSAFSRLIDSAHKDVFEGVFDTLQTGLSKLGEGSASQTKAISDLIYLIRDIPMDGKQDYDVLGFIYEYLISMFAANAGKKAGEFYTPHEVSLLMSEIVAEHLKDRESIKIYDPTSGSGSLLINIGKSASKYISNKDNIKYYAQELKQNTYNLTRMNLVMRGILPDNIVTRNGDTLEDDWPYFDDKDPIATYEPLYVDAVVSNPPYSQSWNPNDKETDPRYARFGLAPKGKADYAFLLHDLFHIKSDGIMTIVLPHGVLFRGGEEGEIRKNLIEQNHIDAIIGLPSNIFFGTGIPTIIMILKQKRENTDVLVVDASKGFIKSGKNNKLRASDIKRIVDVVINRENVANFSRVVSRDEIRNNNYNLNIPRYVDSSEKTESWDIFATMFGGIPKSELEDLSDFWNAFPNLKSDLFQEINASTYQLKVPDIKKAVFSHPEIQQFFETSRKVFSDIPQYMREELIDHINEVHVQREEEKLAQYIFKCLESMPLIDKYDAYEKLDTQWQYIQTDIEILQAEGFDAAKQVDPNLVIKKKSGKEVEVQEGWLGHVFPFELVQRELLADDVNSISSKENRLNEISAEIEELFEELPEEEKEKDFVNDAKDAFVNAKVKKAQKDETLDLAVRDILKQVVSLQNEEKSLKSDVKSAVDNLQNKTKVQIEQLSNAQVYMLLEKKWITPFIEQMQSLTQELVNGLVQKIEQLSQKYDETLSDIDNEIKEAESTLTSMLQDLEGNEFDMSGIQELIKLFGE
ncbi:type I restriction-modification system subunit M [Streptococcus infantarius]|uniref:type I restriction-modification system subunit M n=1 Tax=Streptococcus infantarius TaxID=102684 RepID=UPI00208F8419|nr:type I restriction-modification system subunit M [Streptococcus infantarius]MCO4493382.1 putative type I restriction enzymeP M protein [Streptococcus infantarius subsp. infantarius]MCO4501373.1 putative type I restriction enzymeP M protein [Streptococcus infantarius subsp. infantarius]MCO4504532.1 putative type I restriction enzymeP M protein [Streptococcus infantarius subsp. infantarius]MCY7237818.1 type I restriction-modification system subunit M [Streptococcus infantarius]MCY7241776.1 ty